MSGFEQWSTLLSTVLVQSVFQIAALGLLAVCALKLVGKQHPAMRHAVGMVFLVAMVWVPASSLMRSVQSMSEVSALTAAPASTGLAAVDETLPVASAISRMVPPAWVAWIWCAGVCLMVLRLVMGMLEVGRMARLQGEALPSAIQKRADELIAAMNIRRQVSIRVVKQVVAPCAARVLFPVIWLPASMMSGMSPAHIQMILAHELAHIRRFDWLWNGMQCAIETVLFYHPVVWWLSREIRRDRELACDALAVSVCGDALTMAESLLALEKMRQPANRLLLAASKGGLRHRVESLLCTPADQKQGRGGLISLGFVSALSVLAIQPSATDLDQSAKAPEKKAEVRQVTIKHTKADASGDISALSSIDKGDADVSMSGKYKGKAIQYRKSERDKGKVEEHLLIDGKPTALDAETRAWVEEQIQHAQASALQARVAAKNAMKDAELAKQHASDLKREAEVARHSAEEAAREIEQEVQEHIQAHDKAIAKVAKQHDGKESRTIILKMDQADSKALEQALKELDELKLNKDLEKRLAETSKVLKKVAVNLKQIPSVPPAPPVPAAPTPPADLPTPPAPPAPPAPASPKYISVLINQAVAMASANPMVIALTGEGRISVTASHITSHLTRKNEQSANEGAADGSITLSGDKGQAKVALKASMQNGEWHITQLEPEAQGTVK
ncbi:hypothetical protein KSF73_06805 [Burkholderiaceae bacterium DAT-1]|nr:hypothetical protein [Burkholderiaceae bacterium DAT-1]